MIYLLISIFIVSIISVFLLKKLLTYSKSQKTLQRLLDHTNIGYYRFRYRDGVVLEANSGFVNILELNLRVRDVIGKSLSELLIYIEEEDGIRQKIKTRGALKNYEYHFKTLEGKEKCLLMNAYISRDYYTGEDVVESLIEDITEERLSYENMIESEERYKKLFKNSGDIVIIYKHDTKIVEEVNPITEIITGYTETELIGQPVENFFHPESKKEIGECQRDLLFRGGCNLEAVIVCKNDVHVDVSVTLSIFEHKGETLVMAIMKDVSTLIQGREEEIRRKKEMEDFWKASLTREERIKDLRKEMEQITRQIKMLKEGKEQ